jgi:predicted N-acetyltransferase YhbS
MLMEQHAQSMKLPNASLVAVSGSVPFWQRFGFHGVDDQALAEKLRSCGTASYMVRAVAPKQ